jgi:hypothetical protein
MDEAYLRARLNLIQAAFSGILASLDGLIDEVKQYNETAEQQLRVEVLVDDVIARIEDADGA